MLQAGAMVNDVAHFVDALVRLSITSIPDLQSLVPSSQRRVTLQQDDPYITLTHLRNQFLPATATARQLGVNAQTIRNRLRQNNVPI